MLRALKAFHYFETRSTEETVDILSDYGANAKIYAGGTDLLFTMKHKKICPKYVIYIKNVSELNSIKYDKQTGLKIGATATLESIFSNRIIKQNFGILAQACSKVGTPQVRNVGTIGGNLCQDTKCLSYLRINPTSDVPCYRSGGDTCYHIKGAKECQAMAMAETAPALICLDAKVSIFGPNGERSLPVEAFYVSSGIVYLEENEILKGIEVPNPPPQTSGIYLRHSMRGHLGFALVGVATVLTINKGLCRNARIALLGVARKPMRAYKTEELLTGQRIKPNLIDEAASLASKECHPLGDIFGSANFRREMVKVLVRRAIRDVSERTLKNALTVKAP